MKTIVTFLSSFALTNFVCCGKLQFWNFWRWGEPPWSAPFPRMCSPSTAAWARNKSRWVSYNPQKRTLLKTLIIDPQEKASQNTFLERAHSVQRSPRRHCRHLPLAGPRWYASHLSSFQLDHSLNVQMSPKICNMIFPKMRGGGRSELLRKFIRFGSLNLPTVPISPRLNPSFQCCSTRRRVESKSVGAGRYWRCHHRHCRQVMPQINKNAMFFSKVCEIKVLVCSGLVDQFKLDCVTGQNVISLWRLSAFFLRSGRVKNLGILRGPRGP